MVTERRDILRMVLIRLLAAAAVTAPLHLFTTWFWDSEEELKEGVGVSRLSDSAHMLLTFLLIATVLILSDAAFRWLPRWAQRRWGVKRDGREARVWSRPCLTSLFIAFLFHAFERWNHGLLHTEWTQGSLFCAAYLMVLGVVFLSDLLLHWLRKARKRGCSDNSST